MPAFTLTLQQVSDFRKGNIGLNNFPIFAEEYRETLKSKIADHYWNREIGLESVDRFIFNMERKMREIMPYYNKLYLSELLKYDPLDTMDIQTRTASTGTAESVENGKATSTENSTSESDSDAQSRAIASNFPQQRLSGDKDYASSGQDNVSQTLAKSKATGDNATESESAGTTKQDGNSESSTKGFQGNRNALLSDYRATLLNIDMEIIDELGELFMLLLQNGDSHVQERFTY